jgi:hypothetical protein
MKDSTASFIAYDLRPAKQTERRILLDFVKCGNAGGISVSDCRYVGMGGTKFYDFHLLHRFLGINRMVSLERDPNIKSRAMFNCPYDFIDVQHKTATAFLASDMDKSSTIYWFDYDGALSAEITADIMSLGARIGVGSFAFVTTYGGPLGVLDKQNTEQRLAEFQATLSDFSTSLTTIDMENANFPTTVRQVLLAAFKNAFAHRRDGVFLPLFQVFYRDTKPMVTMGGCFCPREEASKIETRVKTDLPFLSDNRLYRIQNFALTERERALFDLAVTKRRSNSKQANLLRTLGFRQKDLDAYRDLIRFLPRYYESMI